MTQETRDYLKIVGILFGILVVGTFGTISLFVVYDNARIRYENKK